MKQRCLGLMRRHAVNTGGGRGVGSLSTPKQHPYCRQRDAPQYCWRPTPNTAQITLFTETASPVPLSPTFSKHLLRRDTQRKQDNLGTTVRPRNSGQNNSASERPKATPVPSRTWTCALQTTFMPVELAFSWLPGIRGYFSLDAPVTFYPLSWVP